MNPNPPCVLITGTSSGIGRAAAVEMRKRGWRVIAAARKDEDLAALTAEGFESLRLDLADPASIVAAVAEVRARCPEGITGLVNNAGYGQPGALEDLTADAMRRQFEVNVIGLQSLTNALLPDFIARGGGRVVQVSSVVGRIALPFMGIYSASKFAVEAMADAQRVELSGTGVHISLIEPGPILTRFTRNAADSAEVLRQRPDSRFAALYRKEIDARRASNKPKPFSLPPEAVALAIAHALTSPRPRRRYKITFPAHLGACLSRFAPDALLDFILRRELVARQRKT